MINNRSEEIIKNDYYYLTSELSTVNENVKSLKEKREVILSYLNQVKSELSSVIKDEDDLKNVISHDKDEYVTKKEVKVFNSILGLSFLPAVVAALFLIVSGNGSIIKDMGILSIVFTGFPQFMVGTVLYYCVLNQLEKIFSKEYMNKKEFKERNKELEDITIQKVKKSRQLDTLSFVVNKYDGQIKFYTDKIKYIRSQMKECETELANLVCPKKENIHETNNIKKLSK